MTSFTLKLTRGDYRGWIIPLLDEHCPWYMIILATIPAILLVIIVFIEQHIVSVIVNRKEHKLKVRICLIQILPTELISISEKWWVPP